MAPVTVSVCVPTYNGARYLKHCLDSALAQTFEGFEVVVVDDGSTDSTLDIVREYAESDERFKVWRNERNVGLVANWTRCVERARGEWVKFLFQDDLLEPSCLERMVRAARSGVDLVVARRGLIFEEGTTPAMEEHYRRYVAKHDLARHSLGSEYIAAERFAGILLRSPGYNCIGEPTATLMRRSAFARYGRFNPDLVILCDWEYLARVAANTGLCYIDTTLAHFRVHAGAASSHVHSRKAYRSRVIDPLIIMHEILYAQHYAKARAVASRLRPPVDLRSRLADEVRKALWKALTGEDADMKWEWWSVLRRYPRLAGVQLGSVLRSAAAKAGLRHEG